MENKINKREQVGQQDRQSVIQQDRKFALQRQHNSRSNLLWLFNRKHQKHNQEEDQFHLFK